MSALVVAFYTALIACCVSVVSFAYVCTEMKSLTEKNNRLEEENALLRSATETESDGKNV